jgi:hypothetical protein
MYTIFDLDLNEVVPGALSSSVRLTEQKVERRNNICGYRRYMITIVNMKG